MRQSTGSSEHALGPRASSATGLPSKREAAAKRSSAWRSTKELAQKQADCRQPPRLSRRHLSNAPQVHTADRPAVSQRRDHAFFFQRELLASIIQGQQHSSTASANEESWNLKIFRRGNDQPLDRCANESVTSGRRTVSREMSRLRWALSAILRIAATIPGPAGSLRPAGKQRNSRASKGGT